MIRLIDVVNGLLDMGADPAIARANGTPCLYLLIRLYIATAERLVIGVSEHDADSDLGPFVVDKTLDTYKSPMERILTRHKEKNPRNQRLRTVLMAYRAVLDRFPDPSSPRDPRRTGTPSLLLLCRQYL